MKKFTYRVECGEYFWTLEEDGKVSATGKTTSEMDLMEKAWDYGVPAKREVTEVRYFGLTARFLMIWLDPVYLYGCRTAHLVIDLGALATILTLAYIAHPWPFMALFAYAIVGAFGVVVAAVADFEQRDMDTCRSYLKIFLTGPFWASVVLVRWILGK